MTKKTAKKSAATEPQTREKKKFYVVQVAKGNSGVIEKVFEYPEATTNEKALKLAIAKHSEFIVGAQITNTFNSAGDLIKAMQTK